MTLSLSTMIALGCEVDQQTGCWEWTGAVNSHGYGQIGYGGAFFLCHREMLRAAAGKLVGQACHHCDNRRCCNPAHLFDGTQKQNILDMIEKSRGKGQFGLGAAHHNCKLSPEEIAEIVATPKVWGSGRALADKFGVSTGYVSQLRSKKYRVHG